MPPPDSSIGFAAADWALLFLAALLLGAALIWRPLVQAWFTALAQRKHLCFWLFFLAPVVMRLLLLPHHPVPVPDIYDEFSHLLLADTLWHGRLANPPHPLHRFFETFFVLQQPTYSSIYPCGQALVLVAGRLVSGIPWTGILLMSGVFCAASYWMLRGWTTPGWSFLGATFAVMEFGPLCQWTNCYWGGGLAAAAGCLVFGALPRIREQARMRDGLLLAFGFGMHMLARQFESIFLLLAVVAFATPTLFRRTQRLVLPIALTLVPFVVLILAQNKAVTGRWTWLPEQLSRYQYGVPASLTVEPNAIPHLSLTPEQQTDYQAQANTHGAGPDSVAKFLLRLEYRVRLYRFFFLPPLYIALAAFLTSFRRAGTLWIVFTLSLFALGTNLFPYLLDHYLAAVTCLFILISLIGLQQLEGWTIREVPVGKQIVLVLVVMCLGEFGGWYALHLFETPASYGLRSFETWDVINHSGPQRRLDVARRLAEMDGPLLVFVRYSRRHIFQNEWVWNAADIDGSRIVWARDRGEQDNENLIRYYPRRRVLLLEPDDDVPAISAYQLGR